MDHRDRGEPVPLAGAGFAADFAAPSERIRLWRASAEADAATDRPDFGVASERAHSHGAPGPVGGPACAAPAMSTPMVVDGSRHTYIAAPNSSGADHHG